MRKSTVFVHRNFEHILLGIFDALLDSDRHFLRLAHANADMAFAVADDNESRQTEAAAALDDLGNAVDVDHALLKLRNGGLLLFFFARSHIQTLS